MAYWLANPESLFPCLEVSSLQQIALPVRRFPLSGSSLRAGQIQHPWLGWGFLSNPVLALYQRCWKVLFPVSENAILFHVPKTQWVSSALGQSLSCPFLPWWPDLSLLEKTLGHCALPQNRLLLLSWPAAPERPSCHLSCPCFLFYADRESLWRSGCKFLVTWRLLGPFSCSQQAFHSSLKVWLDPPCPSLWRSCPFFCCCVKSGLATCLPFDIPAGGCSLSSAFWCFQETLHFCRLGCSFSPLGWEWCWPTLYISVESGSLPHERTIWKDAEVLVNKLLLLVCLVPAVLRHPFSLSLGFWCKVIDLQTRASPMWAVI